MEDDAEARGWGIRKVFVPRMVTGNGTGITDDDVSGKVLQDDFSRRNVFEGETCC